MSVNDHIYSASEPLRQEKNRSFWSYPAFLLLLLFSRRNRNITVSSVCITDHSFYHHCTSVLYNLQEPCWSEHENKTCLWMLHCSQIRTVRTWSGTGEDWFMCVCSSKLDFLVLSSTVAGENKWNVKRDQPGSRTRRLQNIAQLCACSSSQPIAWEQQHTDICIARVYIKHPATRERNVSVTNSWSENAWTTQSSEERLEEGRL